MRSTLGRVPLLGGHCPASPLLRTLPPGSRLRRTSPLGSHGYLASAGFLGGARSPSLLQPMALCACRRLYPAEPWLPMIVSGVACCLRQCCAGSALGAFVFRGLNRSFITSLRPAHSRSRQAGALSVGFARGISPAGATRAMRLRSSTASRLSLYGSMGTSRLHTTRPSVRCVPSRWAEARGSSSAPATTPRPRRTYFFAHRFVRPASARRGELPR